MTLPIAACVISHDPRWSLVRDCILPTLLGRFEEVVVVGDGEPGDGYRFIPVPKVTGTTLDALMKRDTAAAATWQPFLLYLADDHKLGHHLAIDLRYDVSVPRRFTVRDGHEIMLPMGFEQGYCAGHGILLSRRAVRACPWLAAPHVPTWDVEHSRQLANAGFPLKQGEWWIMDIEPGAEPWR